MKPIWYILVIIVLVLVSIIIIVGRVCFSKKNKILESYSKLMTSSGANANQLATILIANANLPIQIANVNSKHTNYYSSKYKVLKLSTNMMESVSIVSLAQVTQEIGYAILDHKKSFMYKLISKVLPIANIMLMSFIPTFLLGLAFGFIFELDTIGIIITSISLVFLIFPIIMYLVTIPGINKATKEGNLCLDKCNFLMNEETYLIKSITYKSPINHLIGLVLNMVYFIYTTANMYVL